MATITLSGSPTLFVDINIHGIWSHSQSVFHNNGHAIINAEGGTLSFGGSGFTSFDPHGFATAGTINSLDLFFEGTHIAIAGVSLAAAGVEDTFRHSASGAFVDEFFGGDDTITLGKQGGGVSGFDGNDTINGGQAADGLLGAAGDDTLNGGGGKDLLMGGAGIDTLTGGKGDDKFEFDKVSDSRKAGPDTITDLHNTDIIDLSQIDADTNTPDTQHFALVTSFSGTAGELIVQYDSVNNRTKILGDVDGDSKADLVIYATGNHAGFTNFQFTDF